MLEQKNAILFQLLHDHAAERPDGAYKTRLFASTERLQGELVMLGYKLCGGTDLKMVARVAHAIEMLHAAVACLDAGEDEAEAQQVLHQAEIIPANLDTDAGNKI